MDEFITINWNLKKLPSGRIELNMNWNLNKLGKSRRIELKINRNSDNLKSGWIEFDEKLKLIKNCI